MKRFLCFTLLFLTALPVFAQDEQPTLLSRDPAFLTQTRERLSIDLRDTERALSVINPNDTQLVEVLKTRQADLTRQMNDVVRQLQMPGSPNITERVPPGIETRSPLAPGYQPLQPVQPLTPPEPPRTEAVMMSPYTVADPQYVPVSPHVPLPGMPGGAYNPYNPPLYHPALPPTPVDPGDRQNFSQWGSQPPTWEWGPRLPRELIEVKQSMESMQREIAAIRGTVKALETQIQLLNRTVLLSSERMNERGKENGE